jgi:hypothetical protein
MPSSPTCPTACASLPAAQIGACLAAHSACWFCGLWSDALSVCFSVRLGWAAQRMHRTRRPQRTAVGRALQAGFVATAYHTIYAKEVLGKYLVGFGLCGSPTSAPGLGSPQPHRHRDRAHPDLICTGTGLTPPTSALGLGACLPPSHALPAAPSTQHDMHALTPHHKQIHALTPHHKQIHALTPHHKQIHALTPHHKQPLALAHCPRIRLGLRLGLRACARARADGRRAFASQRKRACRVSVVRLLRRMLQSCCRMLSGCMPQCCMPGCCAHVVFQGKRACRSRTSRSRAHLRS